MPKITTSFYGDLAIIPYQAKAPMKEIWEFYTDITIAYNSTEERIQGRSKPRATISYDVPLSPEQSSDSFNTEYGALRLDHAIIMWSDIQYVGAISAGATLINCNTELYDLRDSSLALLYKNKQYELIEIDTVTLTEINLSIATVQAFTNAYLIPVRKGWFKGSIAKKVTGFYNLSTLNYTIDDNPFIEADVPTQYLSNDIYYTPLLKQDDAIDISINQDQQIFDELLGPVARSTNWSKAQLLKPWKFVLENRQEVQDFKNFLFRRAGRFRAFWLPTFENNMRIKNTGTVTTTLDFSSDSFFAYGGRLHIAIFADNVWYPRAISAPTQINPTTVRVTLSSTLNIAASKIKCISYLGLYRLNTDRCELTWKNGIVECTLPILEFNV